LVFWKIKLEVAIRKVFEDYDYETKLTFEEYSSNIITPSKKKNEKKIFLYINGCK
jgi:hypothetical protein